MGTALELDKPRNEILILPLTWLSDMDNIMSPLWVSISLQVAWGPKSVRVRGEHAYPAEHESGIQAAHNVIQKYH